MPLQYSSSDAFDFLAPANVAQLVFGTELGGESAEPFLVSRQQNELPALPCESARDRLADSA